MTEKENQIQKVKHEEHSRKNKDDAKGKAQPREAQFLEFSD
jgi:hypothetical protein